MNDHKCVKAIGDMGAVLWFHKIPKFDPGLIRAIHRHYPGSKSPISGRCLCWFITEDQQPIGYVGLGDVMQHLTARKRLGLKTTHKLVNSVCVFMFQLCDREDRTSHASTVLAKWEPIAAKCWAIRYGFRPVHWETFVNPLLIQEKQNPGACFKRAGYRTIGITSGKHASYYHPERTAAQNSKKIILYKGPLARIPLSQFNRKLQLEKEIQRLCAV